MIPDASVGLPRVDQPTGALNHFRWQRRCNRHLHSKGGSCGPLLKVHHVQWPLLEEAYPQRTLDELVSDTKPPWPIIRLATLRYGERFNLPHPFGCLSASAQSVVLFGDVYVSGERFRET